MEISFTSFTSFTDSSKTTKYDGCPPWWTAFCRADRRASESP